MYIVEVKCDAQRHKLSHTFSQFRSSKLHSKWFIMTVGVETGTRDQT